MKQQDQVCTLEQAKRLKELGITQHSSLFCYGYAIPLNPDAHVSAEIMYRLDSGIKDEATEHIADAYTVSELMNALRIYSPYWITIWGEWGYKDTGGTPRGYENLAHACAAALIDRLENKKTTAEEVNQRLQSE